MAKVRLETWMSRVTGEDEMGRVLTYGEAEMGYLFEQEGRMTIKSEYSDLIPGAIKVIALGLGHTMATRVLHNTEIVA